MHCKITCACTCKPHAEMQGLHRASGLCQGCRDRQAELAPMATCSATWAQGRPGTGSAPVFAFYFCMTPEPCVSYSKCLFQAPGAKLS